MAVYSVQRLLLVTSLLLVCSQIAISQDTSRSHGNLYATALFASLDKMAKDWGGIDDASDHTIRTDYHRMIIEKNDVTENLPESLGAYRVEYLDEDELIDRYRKLGKEFAVLRIHPITTNGVKLSIKVALYWFSYKKTILTFALSDWSNVEFHYDCEKHEWTIDDVKLDGSPPKAVKQRVSAFSDLLAGGGPLGKRERSESADVLSQSFEPKLTDYQDIGGGPFSILNQDTRSARRAIMVAEDTS
jgi:hypothetical protein